MGAAIEVKDVRKKYAGGVEALKGVSLTIQPGDFFALLGPNGAGKTTLIGILSSLVTKSSGEVRIFDHDIVSDTSKAKTYIGLVPQEFNINIFAKVIDIVVDQAGFYGIPRSQALKNAEPLLKDLGLWEKRNEPSQKLSGGMKRRLMIARALIHKPRLLILDEPTAGVDVELRRSMWTFLRKMNAEGVTIILTPLTYLGGIFYSIQQFPEFWQKVSLANPILYMVNAFRYGFLGVSDVPLTTCFAVLIGFTVAFAAVSIYLFKKGTGIKN